jgi:hypothetical protein
VSKYQEVFIRIRTVTRILYLRIRQKYLRILNTGMFYIYLLYINFSGILTVLVELDHPDLLLYEVGLNVGEDLQGEAAVLYPGHEIHRVSNQLPQTEK